MNVVVIVFYSLAGAWLLSLGVFAIVKKIRQERRKRQAEKTDNSSSDEK